MNKGQRARLTWSTAASVVRPTALGQADFVAATVCTRVAQPEDIGSLLSRSLLATPMRLRMNRTRHRNVHIRTFMIYQVTSRGW